MEAGVYPTAYYRETCFQQWTAIEEDDDAKVNLLSNRVAIPAAIITRVRKIGFVTNSVCYSGEELLAGGERGGELQQLRVGRGDPPELAGGGTGGRGGRLHRRRRTALLTYLPIEYRLELEFLWV